MQFVIFYLPSTESKRGVLQPGSTWDQPAPTYLDPCPDVEHSELRDVGVVPARQGLDTHSLILRSQCFPALPRPLVPSSAHLPAVSL